MKSLALSLVSGAILLTSYSATANEWSGNVALTSDYAFRGISQTLEEAAIQGGIDWSHDILYAGFWGSNVNFGDGDQASMELDIYAGLGGDFTEGFSYDFGVLYYAYPGADSSLEYDFWEVYAGTTFAMSRELSYGGQVETSLGIAFSPEYFAESGDAFYYSVDFGIPLPAGFGIGLGYGYQTIDDNAAFGTPDYSTWTVGLNKSIENVMDISVAYVDTDLSDVECFGDPTTTPVTTTPLCDSRVIVTLSRSF